MIAKTVVTAFMAASLLAVSHAGPCRPSSRTTAISATTTTGANTSTASSSSTATFSVTASQSGTGSQSSSTSTVSTSGSSSSTGSSSAIESTTNTPNPTPVTPVSPDPTPVTPDPTPATPDPTPVTPEPTPNTPDPTPVTPEPTPTPAVTYLGNPGFDEQPETTQPWELFANSASLSLDSTIKHDGMNSGRLAFTSGSTNYIRQKFAQPIQVGVPYSASAWVRPGTGCSISHLVCAFRTTGVSSRQAINSTPANLNQWVQISATCTYTQPQVDVGGLYLYVGFTCSGGSLAWVDTVAFSS